MKILLNINIFVLLPVFLDFIQTCPVEPTDFVFIVKASYYLTEDQWNSMKNLITKVSSVVDIGRTKLNSQVSVALFDNLNEPKYVIELGSYGRSSDLSTSVQKIKQLPCGSWCGEQTQKSDEEQISTILAKHTYSRLTKIFIISSHYLDTNNLRSTLFSNENVVLQQVMIPQTSGVVTYDQPYYDYYRAYYDQYRRYAGRYEQLYPYVSVQIPSDQYPYSSSYYPGQENYGEDSWASGTCYSLIRCQECLSVATPAKIEHSLDPEVKVETVNSGDSHQKGLISGIDQLVPIPNSKTKPVSATEKPKANTITEDYEYEITADPPDMKINKTPLLDTVQETSVNDGELIL